MIQEGYRTNFETLIKAAKNDDLCIMECTDKATGKPVITVCAINQNNGEIGLAPVAKLFDGNPYEDLNPPATESVTHG